MCSEIQKLPEECLWRAISLTSPRDSCRSESVSAAFRSAAVSDAVWRSFLPSDYAEILARAVDPVRFGSMKQLYFRLCDPILIDGGNMGFYVDRETGKKCFMLSARELWIVWGDTPQYWRWFHHSESRFAEVAELIDICWLGIRCKINSRMLSKHSHYSAYLLFKLSDSARGLEHPLQNATIAVGGAEASNHLVLRFMEQPEGYRNPPNDPPVEPEEFGEGRGEDRLQRDHETEGRPRMRRDGWMEIEINGGHSKSGLIVEGIEIRPKK